ncbi:MAG: HAMP domain-containing sensor histidine kinase [Oscillospiraceae bacterium]|nr:HAMP domain-containing sensor histidine kinase [Oscillospiraceae bacterium]
MKKRNPHFNLSLIFTLIIMLQIGIAVGCAVLFSDFLYRRFNISFELPPSLSIFIMSLIIGSIFTFLLKRWFIKPITVLSRAMQQVSEGDFKVSLETKSVINEIKDIYANFNLMARELDATEILQTDFVSNVSHEFKTPINAIEGYATLLQGGADSPEQQQTYIDKILINTRRLSELVGSILLLSKIDNQAIAAKPAVFRLDEQVRQAIMLLEPRWAERETEFEVELEELYYTGNEGLLLHVWSNLIANAIKFGPVGGRVKIRLEKKGCGAAFSVEDEGPGVSEEAKKHIFDKFYQADSSHKEEGNGLGLSLTKRILDCCGGEIRLEDAEGCGARFTVFLPLGEQS